MTRRGRHSPGRRPFPRASRPRNARCLTLTSMSGQREPTLTLEEQRRLAEDNLLLAYKVGFDHWQSSGTVRRLGSVEDAQQWAVIGLYKAARNYDPSLGVEFSTFATSVMRSVLLRAGHTTGSLVRVPWHFHDRGRRCRYRREADTALAGAAPLEAVDYLPSGGPDPAREAARADDAEWVRGFLRFLPPRYLLVLTLRFGLDGGGARTLQEIAGALGMTREGVRNAEWRALNRLRRAIRAA